MKDPAQCKANKIIGETRQRSGETTTVQAKSHNGETEREILSASTVNAMTEFRASLC
jgi:hypothetical protein